MTKSKFKKEIVLDNNVVTSTLQNTNLYGNTLKEYYKEIETYVISDMDSKKEYIVLRQNNADAFDENWGDQATFYIISENGNLVAYISNVQNMEGWGVHSDIEYNHAQNLGYMNFEITDTAIRLCVPSNVNVTSKTRTNTNSTYKTDWVKLEYTICSGNINVKVIDVIDSKDILEAGST